MCRREANLFRFEEWHSSAMVFAFTSIHFNGRPEIRMRVPFCLYRFGFVCEQAISQAVYIVVVVVVVVDFVVAVAIVFCCHQNLVVSAFFLPYDVQCTKALCCFVVSERSKFRGDKLWRQITSIADDQGI